MSTLTEATPAEVDEALRHATTAGIKTGAYIDRLLEARWELMQAETKG